MNKSLKIAIIVAMILSLSLTVATAAKPHEDRDLKTSVGPGMPMSWDNIPRGSIIQNNNEIPIRYEIDEAKLKELKKKPFVPSGKNPKTDRDTSVSSQSTKSGIAIAQAPNPISGFEGLSNLDQTSNFIYRPPDPNLATGPNHVGIVVNSEIAFYSKTGTMLKKTDLPRWFSNVFSSCSRCFISDPRIIYDQNEGHWIIVVLGINTAKKESWYLLSVSQTTDPTGIWWNYKLNGNLGSGFSKSGADYPDLGVDGIPSGNGGAIYITSNQFTWTTSMFVTSLLNILPKQNLYTGTGFTYWRSSGKTDSDGSQAFTLRVAQTFGNPSAEYLVDSKSGGGSSVSLWKVVPTYPPTPVNWVLQATVPVVTYSVPPNAQQLGCTNTLDTIDNRIYNVVYRNGNLYAAFTEKANFGIGDVAAIRYLNISTTSNTAQFDTRYGADGFYYWFPAITTDSSGNIVFVFARSSPSEYAGIHYTGRKITDTDTQPSVQLKAGEECITGTRWGDYFGIGNDPSDGSKVWIYGEYSRNIGISPIWDWGTFVGQVSYP